MQLSEQEINMNTDDYATRSDMGNNEVFRISRNGAIFINPTIPIDDAVKEVFKIIGESVKWQIRQAVLEEREACASIAESFDSCDPKHIATAIRSKIDN